MAVLSGGLLVFFIFNVLVDAYTPGTPGAPWSVDTQKTVKAKLYRIFSPHQSLALYKDLHPEADDSTDNSVTVNGTLQKWESMPNSAKVLRLGFHGCFPKLNTEGNVEAGCNGCINTKNMYIRFDHDMGGKFAHDTSEVSHHNGLGPTVEILEKIYMDPAFPPRTPVLADSLFDLGISRADLWAFATVSAIEYAIAMNNIMCEDPTHLSALNVDNYNYDAGTSSSHNHFNIHYGEDQCKIENQNFRITTGRSDCIPPAAETGLPAYHTSSEEIAPDGQGSGADTVNYFKENFGLNGQETVALMGSHTLGMFNYAHTVMHYTWTSRGLELFNNDYYKILGLEDSYIFNSYSKKRGDIPILPVGDPYGAPAKTRWRARVRWDNIKGGPAFWRHDHLTCPDCHIPVDVTPHMAKGPESSSHCCENAPELGNGTQAYCKPGRCEKWRFSKDPEVALNAEIGLVLDFSVDVNGYPQGCPGLENFNYEDVFANKPKYGSTVPDCPRQMLAEPADAKPVSEYVQDYAQDRALWFKDYAVVLAKMLSNGYPTSTIKEESSSSTLTCATPKISPIFPHDYSPALAGRCPQWQCWEEGEDNTVAESGAVQISSSTSILATGKGASLQVDPVRSVCTSSQLWMIAGDRIVNEKTGQALEVDGVSSWELVPVAGKMDTFNIKKTGSTKSRDYLKINRNRLDIGKSYDWIVTKV